MNIVLSSNLSISVVLNINYYHRKVWRLPIIRITGGPGQSRKMGIYNVAKLQTN